MEDRGSAREVYVKTHCVANIVRDGNWIKRISEIERLAKNAFRVGHAVHCTPATVRHDLKGTLSGVAIAMEAHEHIVPALVGCMEDIGECTTVFPINGRLSEEQIGRMRDVISETAHNKYLLDLPPFVRYEYIVNFFNVSEGKRGEDENRPETNWLREATNMSSERFHIAIATSYNHERKVDDYYLVVRSASTMAASFVQSKIAQAPTMNANTAHDLLNAATQATRVAQATLASLVALWAKLPVDQAFQLVEYDLPSVMPAEWLGTRRSDRLLPKYAASTPSVFMRHHAADTVYQANSTREHFVLFRYCTTPSACDGGVVLWNPRAATLHLVIDGARHSGAQFGFGSSVPKQRDNGTLVVLAVDPPTDLFSAEYRGLWSNNRSTNSREYYRENLKREAETVKRECYWSQPPIGDTVNQKTFIDAAFNETVFHPTVHMSAKTVACHGASRHVYSEMPVSVFMDVARLFEENPGKKCNSEHISEEMARVVALMNEERSLYIEDLSRADIVEWQKEAGVDMYAADRSNALSAPPEKLALGDRMVPTGLYSSFFTKHLLVALVKMMACGRTPPIPQIATSASAFIIDIDFRTVAIPWQSLVYAFSKKKYYRAFEEARRFMRGDAPLPKMFEMDFFTVSDVYMSKWK